MCKFETIGTERQYESASKYEADRNFRISCTICCTRGMHICCDKCAIAVAHDLMTATFDKSMKEGENV